MNNRNKTGDVKKIKNKTNKRSAKSLATNFLALAVILVLTDASETYAVEREGGISVGGYGSVRYEYLTQGNKSISTFTLRRIVPTFSATVKERLRFYTELEFERFGLLELVEELTPYQGGLRAKTEIEGTHGSEIKLEQMWGEFEIARALRFRVGGILPPVGRFNILHDDDIWEPARRPLSVRDATVLPDKTAWMEIGAGFNGNFDLGETLLGYEAYVLNGVTLEHDFELYVIGGHERKIDDTTTVKYNQAKLEAVIKPRFGNARLDTKKEKALAGRIFVAPALGYELGFSGYFGRYTPSFLVPANLWTAAIDFKAEPISAFDFEGEYAFTQFTKLSTVIQDIISKSFHKTGTTIFYQSSTGTAVIVPTGIVSEIKVKELSLADTKQGGWVLFRFKFFPSFLQGTVFDFDGESQFILFDRPEYVSYKNTIVALDFKDGNITREQKADISQFRNTVGIAYRPVKTFVFSISYEFTTLLSGPRYIHTSGNENQHAILFGFAFGL
ncbi:MAG: hypothetical protein NZ927_05645 [Candidatus Calescibacterium sp.]|nr:hypothetical protein [Candidatus Calescibacterium sp.]MDW8086545.1 hypothetical protein [Candidatus Calescibacterium sp.]